MGFGRQTANYLERQAQATAARASDDFLSRLQQAEARDAADRPTGAEDPRHALPPRTHMEAVQKNAQLATHQPYSRAGMQQVILPKTAYDHSAAYREQPPPREAAYAKADVKSLYAPPGAHRQIVSRNMRRHYQPIASQVDLSQPTAEPMDLRRRVNYPINLPNDGKDPHVGKGGHAHDRPAGGRANMAGPTNRHGTALHHAAMHNAW